MTIKKKIEKIIDKGGQVPSDFDKSSEWTNFTFRFKKSMSKEIDDIVEKKIGINKSGFILQAIDEKIKKEKGIQ